jgi:hypothetical protein
MAELRGALERSLFGNYVRNAALRKVLKTLQERIQDSDDPIMLPLEDDMSDALHEINTVAGEKESILETAARLQEKLQSLLAFDISDKTREAVDAIAESLGGLREGLPTPSEQKGNIARLGRLLREQGGAWDGRWVEVDSGGFRVELRDLVDFSDVLSRCTKEVEQVLSAIRKLEDVMRIGRP